MKECRHCRRCFPDEQEKCPQDGVALVRSLPGDIVLDKRYQMRRRLGQGGMGIVYKVRHIFLKSFHALKVILPDVVGDDQTMLTRFRQEAMAAAAIRHPNVIAVTDFGVIEDTMPYLVMEFIKGYSLQELLTTKGKLTPEQALTLMEPIAAGVQAAHQQNIVHRDLKPLNIMVHEDLPLREGVKVLDFGLAKIRSGELLGSMVAARTQGMVGSPFYMAPEQWSEEGVDTRADIYSLGVMLYQMLAGQVPFHSHSLPMVMRQHLFDAPPIQNLIVAKVPSPIIDVVFQALSKEPEERQANALSFFRAFQEAVQEANAPVAANPKSLASTVPLDDFLLAEIRRERQRPHDSEDHLTDPLLATSIPSVGTPILASNPDARQRQRNIEKTLSWSEIESVSRPALTPQEDSETASRLASERRSCL